MAIDFTTPTKTQNYDTGVLQSIRANQQALAAFLDGQSITGNFAGLKRYNASSQLFEKSDGTNWSTMPLAYLPLAGGTLTGALTLAANGTAALHAVTVQQLNAALAGTTSSGALAAYAQLAGANFTGSVGVGGNLSTSGSFGASGSIYTGTTVTSAGAVVAGDASLTTTGSFSMTAYGAALPVIQWDSGDSLRFDRTANELQLWIGGVPVWKANAGAASFSQPVTLAGGSARYQNAAGVGFTVQADGSSGYCELLNSAGNAVNVLIDDAGNLQARGLLYGRGGGAGLGQITVQNGGGPSGGAAGDVFFIW